MSYLGGACTKSINCVFCDSFALFDQVVQSQKFPIGEFEVLLFNFYIKSVNLLFQASRITAAAVKLDYHSSL